MKCVRYHGKIHDQPQLILDAVTLPFKPSSASSLTWTCGFRLVHSCNTDIIAPNSDWVREIVTTLVTSNRAKQ